MNVLLLYPEFPDTFWSFKHALAFVDKSAGMPPLGLLTVAALLPPEWNLRLVDMNVARLTEGDLAWAGCVFVSAMVVQRDATCCCHPAVQGGGPARGGGWSALHGRVGGLPPGRSLRPERSRNHPRALPGRLCGRASEARVCNRRVRRHARLPAAALGPGRPEALCDDCGAVLAGLSVRLRVLQHHGPLRPPPARQDRRPDCRRARPLLWPRLARPGLLRGRQPDRQSQVPQGAAASRHHRVAQRQTGRPAVQHGSVH